MGVKDTSVRVEAEEIPFAEVLRRADHALARLWLLGVVTPDEREQIQKRIRQKEEARGSD